jgi:surfactin synthase thioesterase subunit
MDALLKEGKNRWFPFGVSAESAVRVIFLPHAGGGASGYRSWNSYVVEEIGVCPVELPGRGRRHAEQPLNSATSVASRLAPEVRSSILPPYAVFGHSSGAVSAFELCRQLRRLGAVAPAHIFVSGRKAPHLPVPHAGVDRMSTSELTSYLRALDGTPPEVLDDRDLVEMHRPLLIADLAVSEDYRYYEEEPLPVPITAFAAMDDSAVSIDEMAAWGKHTRSQFDCHVIPGGHFGIFEHSEAVAAIIAKTLRPAATRDVRG